MISKYLIAATVFLGISLSTVGYLYIEKIQEQERTQVLLDVSEENRIAIEMALTDISLRQRELEEKNSITRQEAARAIRELEGYRGREATVLAKQELVTKKLNEAFSSAQKNRACLTGDFALCESSQ